MNLGDMLAGNDKPGPGDVPSGVRLTVEPSCFLLLEIEKEARRVGMTREEMLLSMAALGFSSAKALEAMIGIARSRIQAAAEKAAPKP